MVPVPVPTFVKLRFRFLLLASYGSGSGSSSQKVTVSTVPVPVPQHWFFVTALLTYDCQLGLIIEIMDAINVKHKLYIEKSRLAIISKNSQKNVYVLRVGIS